MGVCLAAPALEIFTNLLAVFCTVNMDSLVIFRRFADNFSVYLNFHFIPFHVHTPDISYVQYRICDTLLKTYRLYDR
jgi:hypothetical protein